MVIPMFSASADFAEQIPRWNTGRIGSTGSDSSLVLLDPNYLSVIRIMLKESHELAYAWFGDHAVKFFCPLGRQILSAAPSPLEEGNRLGGSLP